MAKIDWRARLGNKAFWLALVPAVLVLAQFALEAVGIDFDATALEGRAFDLVNAVFTLLAIQKVSSFLLTSDGGSLRILG